MTADQLMRAVEQGHRLAKPAGCPDDLYALMHQCWKYEKESRPSFTMVCPEAAAAFLPV